MVTTSTNQPDNRNPVHTEIKFEQAPTEGAFDVFQSLASKLVAVPKSEIDEQREAQA